jgi:transcriptional regulator with GAF, ATPase, and Fis domain
VEALAQAGWVQARAARGLGLTPRQVAYKIKKYKISSAEQKTPSPGRRPPPG